MRRYDLKDITRNEYAPYYAHVEDEGGDWLSVVEVREELEAILELLGGGRIDKRNACDRLTYVLQELRS